MRRFIISFFSILILYLLQCTVFKTIFALGGIAPNLILMFTCIVGFMRGRRSGMFTGFFGGLLVDIMGGSVIGFVPLIYLFIGYFNGLFHKEYNKEQMLLPISLVALCDLGYEFISYVIHFMLHSKFAFAAYLGRIILPEVVYTVLVTIFAYILVFYINRKLDLLGKKKQARNNVKRELG